MSKPGPNGLTFPQQWPKVSRFIVAVYDGIVEAHGIGYVTVVGYGVIQVDGYANGGGGGAVPALGASGNTCYGHAVPTGVLGQADPYIVQPSSSDPTPGCSFLSDDMQQMADDNANVKLVDSRESDMDYGMASHTP